MHARVRLSIGILLLAAGSAASQPTTYHGITFPNGDVSFADVVVLYEPLFDGGPGPSHPLFMDPDEALGPPNYCCGDNQPGAVSLGDGGRVSLRFTDNALTGSGPDGADDLHIFEVGSQVEATFVEISTDGVAWLSVGAVSGSISSVDIDPFLVTAGLPASTEFRYVRLTDNTNSGGQTGDTVGADIDAVGAISTVLVECPADTNGDGMLSPADFSAWVAAFNAMSAACDQNGDTFCTPADFSAWVANYNAGC